MKTVTIHDAKTNLSKYIAAALKGEKVYIGGFGEAQVVLYKISEHETHLKGVRSFAILKAKSRRMAMHSPTLSTTQSLIYYLVNKT